MEKLPAFFFRYLSSRMLASIVTNAFEIYFLWELVIVYKSVFFAGLIPTIALASELLIAIPFGHMIDKYNSTKLSLLSALSLLFGISLLLIGQTLFLVYLATVFATIGSITKGDTLSATIKKHLSSKQFTAANQNLQGAGYLSTLIGTGLGGISIIFLQRYFVGIILALCIVSVVLSYPMPEEPNREESGMPGSGIVSSLGFIKKLGGFLAVGFVLNGLFVSLEVYSSGLFDLVLKASPIFYTLFIAFLSIGGIIGAVLAGKLQKYVDTGYRLSALIILYSPALLFLALSRSPAGDILDSFSIGLLLPIINIPLQVRVMKFVPRNIYGKVMAFLKVFLGGATPAMAGVFSFVSIFLPVQSILLYIGIIAFPVGGMALLVLPKFVAMTSETSQNQSVKEES